MGLVVVVVVVVGCCTATTTTNVQGSIFFIMATENLTVLTERSRDRIKIELLGRMVCWGYLSALCFVSNGMVARAVGIEAQTLFWGAGSLLRWIPRRLLSNVVLSGGSILRRRRRACLISGFHQESKGRKTCGSNHKSAITVAQQQTFMSSTTTNLATILPLTPSCNSNMSTRTDSLPR